MLCSDQGAESVPRSFVPEVLPAGVWDGFGTGMTDCNCLVQVMTAWEKQLFVESVCIKSLFK